MLVTHLDLSGQMVGSRFELEEKLGEGPLTSSYSAVDKARADTRVFVKLVAPAHPNAIDREVFRRSADRMSELNHANILRLIESGWSDGLEAFYLVIDFLPQSLETYLVGGSSVERSDLYRIVYGLAEALVYAHSQGVVHGSIRPSNVLLDTDGHPYLAEFGVRSLVYDLDTATKFKRRPDGYASPEERAGTPVAFESDIYSLGAVFFHLLSGEIPPSEGLRPPMVDNYITGQSDIRSILRGMVADDPEERAAISVGLLATLQSIAREARDLPRYILVLTDRANRSLYDMGRIDEPHFGAAASAVEHDLNGSTDDTVYVQRDPWNEDAIFVMGSSLRLVCRADTERQALVVVTIHSDYHPENSRTKERAIPCRGMWIPVNSRSMTYRGNDTNELLATLQAHRQLTTVSDGSTTDPSIEQLRSRSEYLNHWRTVLEHYAHRVVQDGLSYSSVSVLGDGYVRFNLNESRPVNLGWRINEPLAAAIASPDRRSNARPTVGQFIQVGNFVDIDERRVLVEANDNDNLDAIPSSGKLMPNPIGHLTAIDRQRRAIQSFLRGDMANKRLADIVVNPTHATRLPESELNYFQDWLSTDKKNVVCKALASNDLFMVQGPPGTGKTTVIAELILQLLKKNPHQRILMASQSNIAVDHALIQVSRANQDTLPELEMLRLGNAQNLDGRAPTLEEKSETSRSTVIETCDNTLDVLTEFANRLAEPSGRGDRNTVLDRVSVDRVVALLDQSDNCMETIKIYEPLWKEAFEWAQLVQEDLSIAREHKQNHLEVVAELLAPQFDCSIEDGQKVIDEAELALARHRMASTMWRLIEQKRRKGLRYVAKDWIRRLFGKEDTVTMTAEAAAIAELGMIDTLGIWVREASAMIADERDRKSYLGEMLQRCDVLNAAVKDANQRFADHMTSLSTLLGHHEDWDDRDTILFELSEKAKLQFIERICQVISIKIAKVTEVVSDWRLVAGYTPDFESLIVDQCNVVGATCVYAGSRQLQDTTFDWAIIDEAGRATAPEALIPIVKSKGVIMVGDERQLPPTIDELMNRVSLDISSEHELDVSLFQSMLHQIESGTESLSADLRTQYRMHPAIGQMISTVFYDGRLEQGILPETRQDYAWLPRPVTWLSTSTLSGKTETPVGTSFSNGVEADIVYWLLRDFESRGREHGLSPTVGVISGYAAQLGEVQRRVSPGDANRWQSLRIEIATVDAFQGRECDIVIYSIVRSNPSRRIGFLQDYRRINVALSRARHLLVIVGDDFTMSGSPGQTQTNPFASVLQYIKTHPEDCALQFARGAE